MNILEFNEIGECRTCGAGSNHLRAGQCYYCSEDAMALNSMLKMIERNKRRKRSFLEKIKNLFA